MEAMGWNKKYIAQHKCTRRASNPFHPHTTSFWLSPFGTRSPKPSPYTLQDIEDTGYWCGIAACPD